MNQKNKGFTLIELLAVIVILAIIALIAVPVIMNIINKANKSAFKDSAYGVISAAELYYAEQVLEPAGMLEDVTITLPDSRLQLKGDIPEGTITITQEGKVAIAVHNNRYCVIKGLEDKDVTIIDDYEVCVAPGFEVLITNLELSETDLEIDIAKNQMATITPKIEPSNATYKKLKWQSSNDEVVTVANGVITAIGEGTASVTATTTDGSNISKSVEVTVARYYSNDIMKSTDNCINNGACLAGTLVKVQVNETDVYNFYVISDTGSEVTLLMDRNIGTTVPWLRKEDSIGDYGNWGTYGYHYDGPITILNYLNVQTVDWTNIPAIDNYTYNNNLTGILKNGYEKLEINNGVCIVTGADGSTKATISGIMRTRLLTHEEYAVLKTANSDKTPTYLYTNLSSNYVPAGGYWFLSSHPDPNYPYKVHKMDYVGNKWHDFENNNTSNVHGARPVITLTK